jgi:DNA-binding NarL/FixJ family response regulator
MGMQRILVVDDHAVIRKGIQSILGAWPEWQVSGEAANGEEAVRLTKDLKPDIVLMDISMPGNGWAGGDAGDSENMSGRRGADAHAMIRWNGWRRRSMLVLARLLVEIGYGRRVDARLEGRGGEWNLRQPMPGCGPREPNCG